MTKTWTEFAERILEEAKASNDGRSALKRRWARLMEVAGQLREQIDAAEVQELLGKSFDELDPDESDLKALIAYAIGRGLFQDKSVLRDALLHDHLADPLAFLRCISGKSFGEKWAPMIVEYWLRDSTDGWDKQKSKAFYDVCWRPHELANVAVRIELKASSENPRFLFQQIRHPQLSGSTEPDYDVLLCLGLTAGTLEWWVIPAADLESLADTGANPDPIIFKHHGKKALIWNPSKGYTDEGWFRAREQERTVLAPYYSSSEELRQKLLATSTPT